LRTRKRQRNERHKAHAANPVCDEKHMQRAGKFDVVDHIRLDDEGAASCLA
jgi:hypothetical protein